MNSFKVLKLFGVLTVLLYVSVTFVQQHGKIKQNKDIIDLYKDKIKNEREVSVKLSKQLELSGTDEYIEREARRRLGLVYPDEKIFVGFAE